MVYLHPWEIDPDHPRISASWFSRFRHYNSLASTETKFLNLLEEVSWAPEERPLIYICGPTSFVETAAASLVDLGHDPGLVRTERFGPSG